jgi:ribonucleotide monophosphatase NagD (HAD superfamily)
VNEFKRAGFTTVDGGPGEPLSIKEDDIVPLYKRMGLDYDTNSGDKPKYDGVIMGWDLEFTFRRLAIMGAILNGGRVDEVLVSSSVSSEKTDEETSLQPKGLKSETPKKAPPFFYATNDDLFDKVEGFPVPGTGAAIPAVEAMAAITRKLPKNAKDPFGSKAVSLGKPNPDFIRKILDWENLDLKKSVFVGDRLDTDILMGVNAGMDTIFVLTGVHKRSDIDKLKIYPTWILDTAAEIVEEGGGAGEYEEYA